MAKMDFDIKSPCSNCPFRVDIAPYLRTSRAQDISQDIEHSTFACHNTIDRPVKQHCAGALIVMLKQERLGDMQQIAERLGLWDSSLMNMDAPVFNDLDEFIDAQQDGEKATEPRRVWYRR